MDSRTEHRNVLDGSTWEFLRAGWWIAHLVALVGVFYLGMIWR